MAIDRDSAENARDENEWVSELLSDAASPTTSEADSPAMPDSQVNSPANYPAMPDSVWAMLDATIRTEQQAREASAGRAQPDDPADPPAASPSKPRRRMGLYALAASAALVVGGAVVISTLDHSQSPAPVAGEQIQEPVPQGGPMVGAPMKQASGDAASVQVLASGTDYTAKGLATQLGNMFKRGLGLKHVTDLETMATDPTPTQGATGVTASVTAEHSCLKSLTGDEQAQALVLDRAKVLGQDAVIVVMKASEAPNPTVAPTAEIQTDMGPLSVWAVSPQCTPLSLTPATMTGSMTW